MSDSKSDSKVKWGVPNPDLTETLNTYTVTEQLTILLQQNQENARSLNKRIENGIRAPLEALRAQVEEHADQTDETIDGLRDEVKESAHNYFVGYSEDMWRLKEELEDVNRSHRRTLAALEAVTEDRRKEEHENLMFKRQMRRQLDELRRLVASSPRPWFPQFSRLPPELRRLVWHFAVPTRLYCEDKTWKGVSFVLSAPAIAHVCRESRAVALRLGRFWKMGPGRNPGWSWFNPDRDAFLLRLDNNYAYPSRLIEEVTVEPDEEWMQFEFREHAGNALLDNLLMFKWGVRDIFPRLHTINVLMVKPTLVDKSWDPSVVSKIFRGESVVVVDLEDEASVQRVLNILEPDTCHAGFAAVYNLGTATSVGREYLGTQTPACDLITSRWFGHSGFWKGARQGLLERYVFNKASWTPLTREYAQLWDFDMNPNLEIPWVEQTVNSLRIRPVHVFALLDGHPRECLRSTPTPDPESP